MTTPPDSTETTSAPSLSRRMACWLYEVMLLFGVVFISTYLFSSLTQTRHALDNRLGLQLFVFVIFGIYFVWFWHKGQTLAMKTWHLRVVGLDGRQISQKRALARYVLSWMWFLPPLGLIAPLKLSGASIALVMIVWILMYAALTKLHPRQQFFHDTLAGTRLISHRPMSKHIPA